MSAYAAARCLGVRSRTRQGNRKIMLEPRKPSAERSKRQVPGSGIDAAAVTVVVSAPVIVALVVSVTVIDRSPGVRSSTENWWVPASKGLKVKSEGRMARGSVDENKDSPRIGRHDRVRCVLCVNGERLHRAGRRE